MGNSPGMVDSWDIILWIQRDVSHPKLGSTKLGTRWVISWFPNPWTIRFLRYFINTQPLRNTTIYYHINQPSYRLGMWQGDLWVWGEDTMFIFGCLEHEATSRDGFSTEGCLAVTKMLTSPAKMVIWAATMVILTTTVGCNEVILGMDMDGLFLGLPQYTLLLADIPLTLLLILTASIILSSFSVDNIW